MKKLIPAVMLAGVLVLAACSGADDNNSAPAYSGNIEENQPAAPQPNPTTSPPNYNTQSENTASVAAQPITGDRTPLPADHPFWDMHGEDADLTVCPVTGAIWDGDIQITFPRGDDVFVPDLPGGGEPVEPGAGPRPQLTASNMRVGQYPSHWRTDRDAYVRYVDFYADMQALGSNMRLQGTVAQLGTHEWVGLNATRQMVWHNDTVSVGIIRLENPEDGVWGRMSIEAWFTNGRDPETGDMAFDNFVIFYSDDMWAINPAGFGFGRPFAEQVWDAIALLDTAQSMADIESAQRVFGAQTGAISQSTIPQTNIPAIPNATTAPHQQTADNHSPANEISRRGLLTFVSEDGEVLLTGEYVAEATILSQDGQHFVSLELNEQGTTAFAEATLSNMGRTIRIYLDDELLATPMISVPIIDGRVVVAGGFTEESAEATAAIIRAGLD